MGFFCKEKPPVNLTETKPFAVHVTLQPLVVLDLVVCILLEQSDTVWSQKLKGMSAGLLGMYNPLLKVWVSIENYANVKLTLATSVWV